MLQQALNRHSQIVIPPETKFFYYLVGQSRRQQLRHIERLRRDLKIDLPVPSSRIRTTTQAQEFYELMADSYCRRIQRTPSLFGEKTPEHTSRVPLLRQTFPDAKVIFIYRDGRDVALSLSKVPWLNCNVNVGIWIWQRYHWLMQRAMQDRNLNFHLVRYEDLVSHPQQEFSSLLDFLGLPDEPAVATGCGNSEGIPQHELSWKSMALKQIIDTRKDVWKRELTDAQIRDAECLAGVSLRAIGYEVASDSTSHPSIGLRTSLTIRLLRCSVSLPVSCLINELAANFPSPVNRRQSQLPCQVVQ
jgi:hypothetical protein